jgi:hypothetical protein
MVNRFVKISALVAVLVSAGLIGAMAKAMTAKQIMARLNKGPNALTSRAYARDLNEVKTIGISVTRRATSGSS